MTKKRALSDEDCSAGDYFCHRVFSLLASLVATR